MIRIRSLDSSNNLKTRRVYSLTFIVEEEEEEEEEKKKKKRKRKRKRMRKRRRRRQLSVIIFKNKR